MTPVARHLVLLLFQSELFRTLFFPHFRVVLRYFLALLRCSLITKLVFLDMLSN